MRRKSLVAFVLKQTLTNKYPLAVDSQELFQQKQVLFNSASFSVILVVHWLVTSEMFKANNANQLKREAILIKTLTNI